MIYLVTNQQELWYRPTNSDIKLATVEESLEYLSQLKIVTCDTETTGLDPHTDHIICIQLGDKENQYVIDLESIDIERYRKFLTRKDIIFIWQNYVFDAQFLLKHDIVQANIYDTFIAETILYRGMPDGTVRRDLNTLSLKYTGISIDKSIRSTIGTEGLTDRVIRYSAKDIVVGEEIREKQLERIKELDLEDYLRLECRYTRVLAYMIFCGIKIDTDKWLMKAKEDQYYLEEAENKLDEFVVNNYSDTEFVERQLDLFEEGIKCNILWSSSKQVIKFLEHLGFDLNIIEKGKKKKSADKKVLLKYRKDNPIIEDYIDYSEQAKLVSTYGKGFLKAVNSTTKRIHTTFKQILNTGRLSSGSTDRVTKISYPNLQNIPANARHRHCFVPENGNVLIVGDYSGQEQVILANISEEPALLDFYRKGHADMHSYIASQIFPELNGLPLNEIKKNHAEKRQLAKGAGFAINYGGTDYTLCKNLNIEADLAKKVYDDYFKAFPVLRNYFNKIQKQSLKDGYITINSISRSKTFIHDIDGYKEQLEIIESPGFWDEYRLHKEMGSEKFKNHLSPLVRSFFGLKGKIERDALNYPIQGTAAEMVKLAGINFYQFILDNNLLHKVKIVLKVHDEIVVECPEDIADKVRLQLKNIMEDAGKVFCRIIPVPCNPVITDKWDH